MTVKSICMVVVSACGFLLTFGVIWQLIGFLSALPEVPPNQDEMYEDNDLKAEEEEQLPSDEGSPVSDLVWALLTNLSLLSIFIAQHSFMNAPVVKNVFRKVGIEEIERSVYVIGTTLSLQVMMIYWNRIAPMALWNLDVSNSPWTQWFFTLIHAFAWIIIYVGSLMMDIGELLGVKQVYYKLQRIPDPLSLKSPELQRLYNHIRHPSFTGFLIILWVYPLMSLDRLLLSFLLTVYMSVMWKTDEQDLLYQKGQLIRKSYETAYHQKVE